MFNCFQLFHIVQLFNDVTTKGKPHSNNLTEKIN